MPDLYVVGSGLAESDKILLDGVQKVKDNDQIKYEMVPAKTVISSLQLKAN
jgi:membrane fusion protein (multidrug efflux system)